MSKIDTYTDYSPELPGPKASAGYLDKYGREITDPTPLEIAIGESVAASMSELVSQLVNKAIRQHLGGSTGDDDDDDDDLRPFDDMSTYSMYSVELQDAAIAAEIDRLNAQRASLAASSAPLGGAAPSPVSAPVGAVPVAGATQPVVDETKKQ